MQSTGRSQLIGSSMSAADAVGATESESDIPILLPVPFQELSSVQFCTAEEQLMELTAALKEQFPRHCFLKLTEQKTQPLLVPFISQPYTTRNNRTWYQDRVMTKQRAISGQAADKIIAAQEEELRKMVSLVPKLDGPYEPAARLTPFEPVVAAANPARKPKPKKGTDVPQKNKASKKSPLDKVLEDLIGRE